MTDYLPHPLDTSNVQISDEFSRLIERLAENTHEVWAAQRLREGWSQGPQRDDRRLTHPGLVPYNQLPESEKEYDRATAMQAVKALLTLGWSLTPPAEAGAPSWPTEKEVGATASVSPTVIETGTLGQVLALWQNRAGQRWRQAVDFHRRLAERLLRLGQPLCAYDVTAEGVERWPKDLRLRQLQGLALARSGATLRAFETLDGLRREENDDDETLGLLARVTKDLADQSPQQPRRQELRRRAQELYRQVFKRSQSYWTGINAATLSLLTGARDEASALARQAYALAEEDLIRARNQATDPYWALATLGEASLVLNENNRAQDWYQQAGAAGKHRYGDLASTRRNARLICDYLGIDRRGIDACLGATRLVVFTGHMLDRPDRVGRPRFPAELAPRVAREIRQRLEQLGAGIGYASATAGADILFLEAMREIGGETHVVLPYDRRQFGVDYVVAIGGQPWMERYEAALNAAAELVVSSASAGVRSAVSVEYSTIMLYGLAATRARMLDMDLTCLALWNGQAAGGPGGAAYVIAQWRQQKQDVEIIDLALIQRQYEAERSGAAPEAEAIPAEPQWSEPRPAEFGVEIMAILFADAVGFSKLSDEQIPHFVTRFLGAAAKLLDGSGYAPLMRNTWGDGLFIVFRTVGEAGRLALELCRIIGATDWTAYGLPANLSLRVALHAGPVYVCTDPITGHRNYLGSQVSQAARIEPITPPGQVYASHAFAALAAVEGVREFECDYVGHVPLAKGYGIFPTYHLRRIDPS